MAAHPDAHRQVRPVAAQTTYALRQQILRPHQSIAEVGFPGDDDPETGHFAAFAGADADAGEPIGVVTVLHQPPPLARIADPDRWWRLRGMATVERHRRGGVGSALVDAALAHVAAHDGTGVWCHARLPAVEFYRRHGFVESGDPWDEPGLGPHVAMWRRIPRPPPP
jgi:GNAT superfamily N-acetyltransferase